MSNPNDGPVLKVRVSLVRAQIIEKMDWSQALDTPVTIVRRALCRACEKRLSNSPDTWASVRELNDLPYGTRCEECNREAGTESDGCVCHSCRKVYRMDLMIPDELWERIMGKPGHSGLLCPACIVLRIEGIQGFSAYRIEEL